MLVEKVEEGVQQFLDGQVADLSVDIRRHGGQVVAVTFWGGGPAPLGFYKKVSGGGLVRTGLLSNDDVPRHDEADTFVGVRLKDVVLKGELLSSFRLVDDNNRIRYVSADEPISSADVNFYPLVDSLQNALDTIRGGAVGDASSLLDSVAVEWEERNIRFNPQHPARSIVGLARELASDLRAGSLSPEDAAVALERRKDHIAEALPDFRLVSLDETSKWNDEGLVSRAGKIWGTYLYDANRAAHLCELRPSYELRYLYSAAEGEIGEDDHETLLIHGAPEGGAISVHCSVIDNLDWLQKRPCGKPSDTSVETYQELVDAEAEYYEANWNIDIPYKLGDAQLAEFVLKLHEVGRDNTNDVLAILAEMTPAARQQIDAYESRGSFEEAIRSFLDSTRAVSERAAALAGEEVTIDGARLASLFHTEVLDRFDTVARIGEDYGQRTVADLFYLQTAILREDEIQVWPTSRILDVVAQLPSGQQWLSYTKPCNKFGEPTPRHDVTDIEPTMR